MSGELSELQIRRKAKQLVKRAYQVAARMTTVNLASLNSVRPKKLRYRTQSDLVLEFVQRANAMMDFAGQLGLISPAESTRIVKAFWSAHPELEALLANDAETRRSKH